MKRPEKKEIDMKSLNVELGCYQNGFNNCIEEYEKFLPNKYEIRIIAEKLLKHYNLTEQILDFLGEAISERLEGN